MPSALIHRNTRTPRVAHRSRRGVNKSSRASSKLSKYRSTNKMKMTNKLRPLTETKSRTAEEVFDAIGSGQTEVVDPTVYQMLPNDDALTHVPMVPFLTQHQGLNEDEMIGLSNYTRWLKCKIQIKLPEGVNSIKHPADLYVVHGWIKAPMAKTTFTPIKPSQVLPSTVSTYIANHVKDFFDSREDRLRFVGKSNTNIKILGYKRVKPNRNGSLGIPATAFSTDTVPTGFKVAGANPIINTSCTWKIMRKIHYTHGAPVQYGATDPSYKTLYPNESWLPFLVFYNPTFAEFGDSDAEKIEVATNTACWYSDM